MTFLLKEKIAFHSQDTKIFLCFPWMCKLQNMWQHKPYCILENASFIVSLESWLVQDENWWNVSITYDGHFQLLFSLVLETRA